MVDLSVVVPVRNEAASLRKCLDAVFSQTLGSSRYEVIVVDGHSDDGTHEVIESYPVRFVLDGQRSVGEARNRGIEAARAPVVAFTDGDCVPDREWLSQLLSRFSRDPSLAGVGGALRCERTGSYVSWYEDIHALTQYRGFITSNVAYRRDVLLQLHGFDERLCCAEDWDLYARALAAGHEVAFEPSALVTHCPVENRDWRSYARKQFWYARHDVRALIAAAPGALRGDRSFAHGWVAGPAAKSAASAALLAVGAITPAAAAAGGALLARGAIRDASRVASFAPLTQGEKRRMAAFTFAKDVVRGAGTWVGLFDALVQRGVTRESASSLSAVTLSRVPMPMATV